MDYQNYMIEKDIHNDERDLRLEKSYELCVSELGLQQSKRDQTIAFYIAIISFVIPAIIQMDVNNYVKAAGFFTLYVLGNMLTKVIVRYRIYKEVYWITCRTITQLYNFYEDKITKVLVQHIFYKSMEKNKSSVIVTDKKNKEKIHRWKTFLKIRNSAETILFEVMVLMSSLVLWISIFLLMPAGVWGAVLATAVISVNYVYFNVFYYNRLVGVYGVFVDGSDEAFNATYSKAWFLHGFYK